MKTFGFLIWWCFHKCKCACRYMLCELDACENTLTDRKTERMTTTSNDKRVLNICRVLYYGHLSSSFLHSKNNLLHLLSISSLSSFLLSLPLPLFTLFSLYSPPPSSLLMIPFPLPQYLISPQPASRKSAHIYHNPSSTIWQFSPPTVPHSNPTNAWARP